jgi:hypothetical protein
VEEMEVDVPRVQQREPRTTNTSWAVGSNIAVQHRYLVQEAYDAQRRYSPGEEVAFITGQLPSQGGNRSGLGLWKRTKVLNGSGLRSVRKRTKVPSRA